MGFQMDKNVELYGSSRTWDNNFGTDGCHNIETNPRFTDPVNGNYTLKANNPAKETGDEPSYRNMLDKNVSIRVLTPYRVQKHLPGA